MISTRLDLTTILFCSLEKTSLLFEMITKITSKNETLTSEGECKYRFSWPFLRDHGHAMYCLM